MFELVDHTPCLAPPHLVSDRQTAVDIPGGERREGVHNTACSSPAEGAGDVTARESSSSWAQHSRPHRQQVCVQTTVTSFFTCPHQGEKNPLSFLVFASSPIQTSTKKKQQVLINTTAVQHRYVSFCADVTISFIVKSSSSSVCSPQVMAR